MQVERDRENKKSEQIEIEESNTYSLFVYAARSQVTGDYYLRRLRIFFNNIGLLPEGTMKERCNQFAAGTRDPIWAFGCTIKFLQHQQERVEKEEATGATLRNFLKSIKLFCEMSDIPCSMDMTRFITMIALKI